MRHARFRWLVLLGVLQPGCSFYYYAAQNLVEEPVKARDQHILCCRYRRMAEDAWQKAVADQPPLAYAYHYGAGFQAGYADYLNYDGTGQPPAAPPFVYRTAASETPEGRKNVEDWYAGFRQGAAAARLSGLRDGLIVLPLGLPPASSSETPPPEATPPAPPTGELLPLPRLAPPPPDDAKGKP